MEPSTSRGAVRETVQRERPLGKEKGEWALALGTTRSVRSSYVNSHVICLERRGWIDL